MVENQSTQVPMRSKTMALGTAGDVETADMFFGFDDSVQYKATQQPTPKSSISRDMVGQNWFLFRFQHSRRTSIPQHP